MIEVEMHDGVVLEFPEGTADDVIDRAAKDYITSTQTNSSPAQAQQPPQTSAMDAGIYGAMDSAMLGWADEATGVIGGLVEGLGRPEGFSGAYQRTRDNVRQQMRQAETERPGAYITGQVAGGLASAALPGGAVSRGASLAQNIGRGAIAGAGTGAIYGAGAAENMGQVVNEAAKGALIGGAVGGAVPVVANKLFGKSRLATADDFNKAAKAAYQESEAAGVVLAPQTFNRIADDLYQTAVNAGADQSIHPKVTAAVKRFMAEKGSAPGFENMERLRRVLSGAASSIEPDERRIAGILKGRLDEIMSGLSPQDVIAGNSAKGLDAYKRAREMYLRKSLTETVDTAMDRAETRAGQFSQSGMENAIRTEMRQIAMNPKRLRRFNKTEQELIKRAARGGPIENAARWLGKLSPKGVVSAMPSLGAGLAIDPTLGASMAAAGYASNKAAEALARRTIGRLEREVRRGAPLKAYQPSRMERAVNRAAPFIAAPQVNRAPLELTVAPTTPTEMRRLEGLLGR